MDKQELKSLWEREQSTAHIHGWDFSHISGRYDEENDLPWDYETIVKSYLKSDMRLLDYDTGGGEFLLSLKHPHDKTAATEGYPPNVELCAETLLPLGVVVCADYRMGVPRLFGGAVLRTAVKAARGDSAKRQNRGNDTPVFDCCKEIKRAG